MELTNKAKQALASIGCYDFEDYKFNRFLSDRGLVVRVPSSWYAAGRRRYFIWQVKDLRHDTFLEQEKIYDEQQGYECAIVYACEYIKAHPEECYVREKQVEVDSDATPYADYLRMSYAYRNDGNLTGLDDR